MPTVVTDPALIQKLNQSAYQSLGINQPPSSAGGQSIQNPQSANYLSPGVGLNQSITNADTSKATQQPTIDKATADAQLAVNQADQQAYMARVGARFAQAADPNTGYVDANTFNDAKNGASNIKLPVDEGTFDNTFSKFIKPNDVSYQTASSRNVASTIKNINNLVQNYDQLRVKEGPLGIEGLLASIPGLGKGISSESQTYEDNRNNQSATIRNLVGQSQSTGQFRFTQKELDQISSYLPSIRDTQSGVAYKKMKLDQLMKSEFGVGLQGYDSSQGGNNKGASNPSPSASPQGGYQLTGRTRTQ